MPARKYLYVFFSLFFLLSFSSKALALTQFNPNPNFAIYNSNYFIEDYGSVSSTCYFLGLIPYGCTNNTQAFSVSFNNTSLGSYSSNSMLLQNTLGTVTNETLRITPLIVSNFYHTENTSLVEQIIKNGYTYLFVPKDTETIIFLRFRINGSENLDPSNTKLFVNVLSNWTGLETFPCSDLLQGFRCRRNATLTDFYPFTSSQFSGENNTIQNATLILPPSLDDNIYQITASFRWITMSPLASVQIDKFDVFTFDDSIAGNNSNSLCNFYCNTTTTPLWVTGGLINANDGYFYNAYYGKGYDNFNCSCVNLKNIIFTRRILSYWYKGEGGVGCNQNMVDSIITRDFVATENCVGNTDHDRDRNPLLFTEINKNYIRVIGINDTTYSLYSATTSNLSFDEYGNFSLLNIYNMSLGRLTIIPINSIGGGTGNNFKLSSVGEHTTDFYPFFSHTCSSKKYCDSISKKVFQLDSFCNPIFIKDCSIFGCNGDSTDCASINYLNLSLSNYGQFCVDNQVWITYNSTGIYPCDSITCCDGINTTCVQKTSTTIQCLTALEKQNSNVSTTTDVFTNPFNALASITGSLIGLGGSDNLPVSQAFTSILISLISGLAIAIYAMTKKHDGADKILAYTFLGVLTLFTIAFGNLLLWAVYAVLVIISAGILTGYFGKLFGGG